MLRTIALSFAITAPLLACSGQEPASPPSARAEIAKGALIDGNGQELGHVSLDLIGEKLILATTGHGLEPGEKAFHLHMVGECDAPDFTSAGGHLNPLGRMHGRLNDAGAHLGDLPNIYVAEDGSFMAEAEISGDATTTLESIQDDDGTAVMIHAGPDDYITDPSGDAGSRVACAVLLKAS
ncbi:MAG: superoxide dismutase family protein [Sphingomonadales bacterium]|nr:MAG: superoxide dismutase family protein [Sphingomonadales bacterium]